MTDVIFSGQLHFDADAMYCLHTLGKRYSPDTHRSPLLLPHKQTAHSTKLVCLLSPPIIFGLSPSRYHFVASQCTPWLQISAQTAAHLCPVLTCSSVSKPTGYRYQPQFLPLLICLCPGYLLIPCRQAVTTWLLLESMAAAWLPYFGCFS